MDCKSRRFSGFQNGGVCCNNGIYSSLLRKKAEGFRLLKLLVKQDSIECEIGFCPVCAALGGNNLQVSRREIIG